MKNLLLILLCLPIIGFGQSKKKIIANQNIEIENLKSEIKKNKSKIFVLENQIFKLKSDANNLKIENQNFLKENQKLNKLLYPDVSNLDEFTRSLFLNFKYKKYNQLKNTHPNYEQFLYLFKIYNTKREREEQQKKLDKYANEEFYEKNFNIKNIENTVNEYYIKGEGMGIDWTTAKFDKIDDVEFRESTNEFIRYLYIYFNAYNNKTESYREYKLRVEDIVLISNKWLCAYDRIFDGLHDLTQRKEERRIREENDLKKPRDLKIKGFKWSYYDDKPSTINNVRASFSNQTDKVIKSIKYRISIFTKYPKKYRYRKDEIPATYKIFSKTYETNYSFTINPGDVLPFKIKDLNYDYFLGNNVVNQGEDWTIIGEIIEVKY